MTKDKKTKIIIIDEHSSPFDFADFYDLERKVLRSLTEDEKTYITQPSKTRTHTWDSGRLWGILSSITLAEMPEPTPSWDWEITDPKLKNTDPKFWQQKRSETPPSDTTRAKLRAKRKKR